jgi:hypothetical protein
MFQRLAAQNGQRCDAGAPCGVAGHPGGLWWGWPPAAAVAHFRGRDIGK